MEIEIRGARLQLDYRKAFYWVQEQTLVLSDLHIGKVSHFRGNGTSASNQLIDDSLEKLKGLLEAYQPAQVLFVGDLFHATVNHEWQVFARLVQAFSHIHFALVKGNHDRLAQEVYDGIGLKVYPDELVWPPFRFVHIPVAGYQGEWYNITGHLHTAVRFNGRGKQTIKLPCFYFGRYQAILPAFSDFAGVHLVNPKGGEQVVTIAGEQLMPVDTSLVH